MKNLKGWRTIGIGLVVAIAPSALDYLGHIDWTRVVGPNVALLISGAVMVGLRLITDTSVGKSE